MYPWRKQDTITGMHPGCEHQGKPLPPMREKWRSPLEVLLGCPVDSRLGWQTAKRAKARIGVYHSRPENPRPNLKPKESVA